MKKHSQKLRTMLALFIMTATMGTMMAQVTYTISDYTAGVQYAANEEHVLDDDVSIYTTECYFTTELRVYSSSTHNGFFVSNQLPEYIQSLSFNLGYKNDNVEIYGSNDGSSWLSVGTFATTVSYNDVSLDFGDNNYKYFKFDVQGANQIRVKSITITYKSSNTVSTPTFTPAAGIYQETQNVEIACATDGASIYYTIDGTEPTTESSLYASAINVATTTTIKAIAVKSGMANSEIATALYEIMHQPAPSFDVSRPSAYPANTPIEAVVTVNSDGGVDMLCGAHYVIRKDGVIIEGSRLVKFMISEIFEQS